MGETGPRPTGGQWAASGSAEQTITVRVVRLSRSNWTVAEVARRGGGVVVVLGPVQQRSPRSEVSACPAPGGAHRVRRIPGSSGRSVHPIIYFKKNWLKNSFKYIS